jgi:type VI secretion system secreted protein VgrG
MPTYTQENRLISIKVDGKGADDLLLQSFTCVEGLSRPFSIQAEVLSDLPTVDFTSIIGQKATITLNTNDITQPRYFNGYVSRFAQSGSDKIFHHYHMEIVPWIWFLTRHADCRIFHNMTIPDIVQKVFDTFTAKTKGPIQPNLQDTYTKQEYVVQYRETSLNFISRLLEHAGIYYYFQHTKTDHTLMLVDKSSSATDCPIQASASHIYRNTDALDEDNVMAVFARREFKTGSYTSTDYNFKTPSASMVATENTVVNVGGNDPLEMFDYPGIHGTAEEGRKISKIRMEEHEAAHHLISGSGMVRGFIPGYTFTMKDHYRGDLNVSYLLTEVRHAATVGGTYQTEEGGNDSYTNQFTSIPKSVPYRPPRVTPKPLVQGPQTAVVIGKAADSDDSDASDDGATGDGEEIWVDKYGRIIVRFPWDRAGQCSCRVRVSQQWAGLGWGAMAIPRVGQEVIVSFLDGDPDRPIVTGCVYNANQTVPYALPDYQTRSTFMTRSSKGGGTDNYNELRFEDKTSSEQIFIRGEKDFDTRIKNDSREWIGNNRSLMVTKDQMEKVGGNLDIQIGGDRVEKVTGDENIQIGGKRVEKVAGDEVIQIGGNRVEKVGGDENIDVSGNLNHKAGQTISIQAGQNLYEKSGQNFAHEAGQAIHLKAGMTMVLEAGMQLSLKVGGNFIDIGPAGVSIQGTMVMINSGGSAGSGCGSSPTNPASTSDPKDPKDPDQADDGSKGTKMN